MIRSVARGLAGALLATFVLAGCKFNDNSGGTTYDGGFDGFAPTAPLLVAAPASADFGMVGVGSKSATKTIVVANVGPGTTGSLAVTLSGGSDFVIDTDGCNGMSLATTGNCSVAIHFAPTTSGSQSASLQVSATPGGTAQVSLSGTGAGASSLAIAPTANDFGALQVGTMSMPATFTVTNKGNGASGAVTVALSGSDAQQFAVSSDLCSGKTLAPLATCTVNVSANPTAPGSKAATLTAQAAGDNGTATASLSANALAGPTFVINPPTYDFGPVVEGTPPGPGKTFTVQNVGSADAGLPALAVTGPNAQDFTIATNMCTAGLAPMGTCSFALTFLPSTGMPESATVTASAANAMSGQASVTGTGLTPAAITITPSSQPFAPLVQGAMPSADVPFQVKNTGAVATGALAVSLAGTNADQFGLGMDGCTGQMLGAGATCTVNVHFAPTTSSTSGSLQASLQVGGMPGGQTAATLTATSIAPAHLTVTPTTQPLGSVLQGGKGPDLPLTVSNTGDVATGPITVALSGMMMADFGLGMDGCTGQTLMKGGSCTVYAHFAPAAGSHGNETATLTVSASPGGSVPVTLTGTAQAPAQLSITQPQVPEWSGVGVGDVSTPVTFTLQNLGDATTGDISFPPATGNNGGDFIPVAPNPCTGPLAGGQSCMFQVQFWPTTAGSESATLQAAAAPGGVASVNLVGTALWVLTLSVVNEPSGPNSPCNPRFITGASISATDGSISCSLSNTCTALYNDGAAVSLQPGPTTGFGNLTWVGCSGSEGGPCVFTMTSNMAIIADYCGEGG
jgi:hypothetical protein